MWERYALTALMTFVATFIFVISIVHKGDSADVAAGFKVVDHVVYRLIPVKN